MHCGAVSSGFWRDSFCFCFFFFSPSPFFIQTWQIDNFLLSAADNIHIGEEIVAGDDLYGGTDRLLSQVIPKNGVVVKLVWFVCCAYLFYSITSN